jgi:hypothetical protein
MGFEKKIALVRALRKIGVNSAKDLNDLVSDSRKLLASGMSITDMNAVLDLATLVGKSNALFDWLAKGD